MGRRCPLEPTLPPAEHGATALRRASLGQLILTDSDQALAGRPVLGRSTDTPQDVRGHRGESWQQRGTGMADNPPVRIAPHADLPGILAWTNRLLDGSAGSSGDDPKPNPDSLYPSGVRATMPRSLAYSLNRPSPCSCPAPTRTRWTAGLLAFLHRRAARWADGWNHPPPGELGAPFPDGPLLGAR